MYSLEETIERVNDLGYAKVQKNIKTRFILGAMAGAFIALGYMAYFKTMESVEGGLGLLLGASIFPIGLMLVLMAGGELLTGNMAMVGTACFNKKVSFKEMITNWVHIFLGNFIGAFFVAVVFVLYLKGIDPSLDILQNTIQSKLTPSSMQMLVSGIGCNIFVGISVWMYVGAKDGFLKFISIWFPVMVFVLLGFQHVVANMFLFSIGLLQNTVSIGAVSVNLLCVFVGNALGGAVLVGILYSLAVPSLKH